MTEDYFPITPPPELVQQWHKEACKDPCNGGTFFESKTLKHIATQAARWGANQELEACCEWLETGPYGFSIEATAPSMTKQLRTTRRTKPPSLKEQSLALIDKIQSNKEMWQTDDLDVVRRALESLPK